MRNIFDLTKREQRLVIAIVVALVMLAFAKHWWERESEPPQTRSASTPTASPTSHPEQEQPESEDSH